MLENEIIEKFRLGVLSQTNFEKNEWEYYQNFIYENGIGMEETLKFLNFLRPSEVEFYEWFNKLHNGN